MMSAVTMLLMACGKNDKPDNVIGDESYRVVKLVDMSGDVKYTRDSKVQAAYLNMNFENKDTVETGIQSSASIALDEDKKVVMGADTSITMVAEGDEQSSHTIITLDRGEIMNSINQKLAPEAMYEIKTSNATIGVRGTVFYVKADKDATTVYCHDGVVAVKTGETQESISQGQALKVEEDTIFMMDGEAIKNELSPQMLEELSVSDAMLNNTAEDTQEENQQTDKLPNGATLEDDGYYWIRYEDGSWTKYDSQGRCLEEMIYSTGSNGDRYSMRTYITDEYGFNHISNVLEYERGTDTLIATYYYNYTFVEERPVDNTLEGVTKKVWYSYETDVVYPDGSTYKFDAEETTVLFYENGTFAASGGWN